jgi:hypothetical protein
VLTTDGGGALPVRVNGTELVFQQAVYRTQFEVEGAAPRSLERMKRGTVVISGGRESMLVPLEPGGGVGALARAGVLEQAAPTRTRADSFNSRVATLLRITANTECNAHSDVAP